jgi:hypothetical protein
MAENKPGLTNLEAWWALLADTNDSHGSNNLTNNGITFGGGIADFEYAEADYAIISDNASLSMGADSDFTIGAVVNMESKTDLAAQIIIRKGDGAAATNEYSIYWEATGDRFRGQVSDGTTLTSVIANNLGAPSLATDYLVIVWHDSTANTINIQVNNGTVDSQAHAAGTQDGTRSFCLGRTASSANFYWDGTMKSAFLYKDRVLTANEREWMYNSGSFRSYEELAFIPRATMF